MSAVTEAKKPAGKKPKPKNPIEEIKKRKDGYSVWQDILRYSKEGFDSIEADDKQLFKWHGIYEHRPNTGHFMMRIKVPGGVLSTQQCGRIAEIANHYGRGLADITTRQTIQYHWLTIEDIPTIVAKLNEVGLHTIGACGDVPRNVVCSAAAGLTNDEVLDPRPYVKALNEALMGDPEFVNLPRKFKISVSGDNNGSTQPEVNCVGLVGARLNGDAGFDLRVGGGLSTQPHMAQRLNVFVQPEKIVDVVRRIAEIFRDCGYRERRTHARLKYLVKDWGAEKFREELETRLGYKLPDATPNFVEPVVLVDDYLGVHEQKEEGLFLVGVNVLAGRTNGDQLQGAADLAERFGSSEVRLTRKQNFLIPNVPREKVNELKSELAGLGFEMEPSEIRKGCVSCTGKEFCNLAIAETKAYAEQLALELEAEVDMPYPVRMNINGCPNSCGQHHVAEIGLLGCQTTVNGEKMDAFTICLGGGLGKDAYFAEQVLRRVPAMEVKGHLVNLLKTFLELRRDDESLQAFCARHDREDLAAILRGEQLPVAVSG